MKKRYRNKKFAKYKVPFLVGLGLAIAAAMVLLAVQGHVAVFHPKGIVASKERKLIIEATLLMLAVAVPFVITAFVIAYKYRATNEEAKYEPEWDGTPGLKFLWWAILGVLVIILSVMNWKATHELDPYKQLVSDRDPLTIEVVALEWKWLFIYPEQQIATVNFVEFPAHVPIRFKLTADAPMNSFWIPQLGGQMYSMAGMSTQLNLMASEPGEFAGSAAEINGKGFSGMRFTAKAVPENDFNSWVESVRRSPVSLTTTEYDQLAKPSENNPRAFYADVDDNLYDMILHKYMAPLETGHRH